MSRTAASLLVAFLAAGCATAPPPLPAERTRPEGAAAADPATCARLVQDLSRIDGELRATNARIETESPRNQSLTYAAAVIPAPPLLVLAEPNVAERQAVARLYRERDETLARAAELGCPLPR